MTTDKMTSLISLPPEASTDKLKALATTAYQGVGRWFLGLVCTQIVLLLAIIGANAFTLTTGTEVCLKMHPIDPFDPFRGNYMTLAYDISEVECPKQPLHPQQIVYAVLKQPALIKPGTQQAEWVVSRIETAPPVLPEGEVFIKGKVMWTGPVYDKSDREISTVQKASIHYGIEQYYIPEATGRSTQRGFRDALVAVDRFGNASVKKLVY